MYKNVRMSPTVKSSVERGTIVTLPTKEMVWFSRVRLELVRVQGGSFPHAKLSKVIRIDKALSDKPDY